MLITSTLLFAFEEYLLVIKYEFPTIGVLLELHSFTTLQDNPSLLRNLNVPTAEIGTQRMSSVGALRTGIRIDCRIADRAEIIMRS
jgi:hypothetical protein